MSPFPRKTKLTSSATQTAAEMASGAGLASVLPDDDDRPWYRIRHLLLLNLIILVPSLSSATVGFDGALMNGLQTADQWRRYFNQPSASILGVTNAIYPIGKIMGIFPATQLADKHGRKSSMWVGFLLAIIGAGIQAGSIHIAMFIASRCIIGVGTAFITQPTPILVAELAYPTHRGKMTAMYQTFFFAGAIFAAWSVYGTLELKSTWSWRIPSLLQGAFPSIQLAFLFLVPESPRWLVANGRKEEARKILTKWHAGGDENSPLIAYEMGQIDETLRLEREMEEQLVGGGGGGGGPVTGWLTLLKTAPNRRRTIIAAVLGFFSQWSGGTVVSYYITLVLDTVGITESKDQALINGLLQVFNWLSAVLGGALMVDRIGRRPLFLVSTAGMFFSYVAWTALSGVFTHYATNLNTPEGDRQAEHLGRAVVAFIFVYNFFFDIAWVPLLLAYPVEIFPYSLRGRGISVTLVFTYLGLILGQFLNPIAMEGIGWKYYIVFCCILLVLFFVIWYLCPETRGRTLEEIAEVFEGPSSSSGGGTKAGNGDGVQEIENA